jgi:hypothetical protein
LWGGDEKKRKIHGRRWEKISIPKSIGGMGFRDFQPFIEAMWANQAWRLMMKPDSLCDQVLCSKYFHDRELLSATRKHNGSHIWNAILHGQEAMSRGLIMTGQI